MAKEGRKTKYKKIYAKKILKFFQQSLTKTLDETYYYKDGTKNVKKTEVANDLPTMTDFAETIKVDDQTLKNWADEITKGKKPKHKHPEFFSSYYRAKELQMNFWLKASLKGLYNPYFAGLVGKNMFGWKDRVDHTTKDKELPTPIYGSKSTE